MVQTIPSHQGVLGPSWPGFGGDLLDQVHWQFLVQELPTLCWRQNAELTHNMGSHQRDMTSPERRAPAPLATPTPGHASHLPGFTS